jgi:hypothetical protein
MTIALVLKVGDGVIIGADSAGTLTHRDGRSNVYFSSEKVFNLIKGWPLGMATYGLGGLDGRSVGSLTRDLRTLLRTAGDLELAVDYTVEQAAQRVRTFFYEQHYAREFAQLIALRVQQEERVAANNGNLPDGEQWIWLPALGFLVCGYTRDAAKPEIWEVQVDTRGRCEMPSRVFGPDDAGVAVWRGQPEAISRLLLGYSPKVLEALVQVGIPEESALAFLRGIPIEPLIQSAMPIQDAIDLAHFLINVTCGYEQYTPGPPTVHRPIDSAAITRHEGFRWVRRKHYYSARLNPEERA